MDEAASDKQQLTPEEIAKLRELVLSRAKNLNEDDLRVLLSKEAKAEQRVQKLQGLLPRFAQHVRVGFSLLKDYTQGSYRQLPWWSVASVGAALGYFLLPTDLIPDFIPGIGYLDDAAVLAAVIAGIREDLKKYADAKGLKLE